MSKKQKSYFNKKGQVSETINSVPVENILPTKYGTLSLVFGIAGILLFFLFLPLIMTSSIIQSTGGSLGIGFLGTIIKNLSIPLTILLLVIDLLAIFFSLKQKKIHWDGKAKAGLILGIIGLVFVLFIFYLKYKLMKIGDDISQGLSASIGGLTVK